MTRWTAALTLCLLAVLPLTATPAAAGGGCHGGVTQGSGNTVEMIEACFTPTTLRIEAGDEVTFVNRDGFPHNVTASRWGNFDDMERGDAFTATFAEEGVYPYACTYHPGMSGAIVVGDGEGAGSGTAVTVEPFQAPPAPSVEIRTVTTAPGAASPTIGWAGGVAIGLAVGIGIGALVRRRWRPAST